MTVLVTSRTREIGIRMALGADPRRVHGMVLRASMTLVAAGVLIGAAVALGLSRVIESQLFGIRATDPLTFAAVAFVVAIAGTLATWHPARRAARVDPVVTLRTE
jgi:putative ABC transport system permease protein